jgi:hypothetical protein
MNGQMNVNMDDIMNRLFQAHQPQGPAPASDKVIDSLPQVTMTPKDLEEQPRCTICQDDFETESPSQPVLSLPPCNHRFHKECITGWLKLNGTCPVCRIALTEKIVIQEPIPPQTTPQEPVPPTEPVKEPEPLPHSTEDSNITPIAEESKEKETSPSKEAEEANRKRSDFGLKEGFLLPKKRKNNSRTGYCGMKKGFLIQKP